MKRHFLALALLTTAFFSAHAQQEGVSTQALVGFDSKKPVTPDAKSVVVKVNNRAVDLAGFAPVPASGTQVAVLIDDGLRGSLGREIESMRTFVKNLPAGVEVFVGYMQSGRVVAVADQGFTTDHESAAAAIRLSQGTPGASASPYFCLSYFAKHWPGESERQLAHPDPQIAHKARIVLMITNGVDPYNGSTSILNQNSPYVQAAQDDAQEAGISVYSIYYPDAGLRYEGGRGSFSGQSYLDQIAVATGGVSYYQGSFTPVSLAPYLENFQKDIASLYVATFPVNESKGLARLKISTNLSGTRVRAPELVRAGAVVLQ